MGNKQKSICQRCKFHWPIEELQKEWTGLWVCQFCYDPRPTLAPAPKRERILTPFPEPPSINVSPFALTLDPHIDNVNIKFIDDTDFSLIAEHHLNGVSGAIAIEVNDVNLQYGNVLLQCEFDNNSETDVSQIVSPATLGPAGSVSNGVLNCLTTGATNATLSYSNGGTDDLNGHGDMSFTFECYINFPAGTPGATFFDIMSVNGNDAFWEIVVDRDSNTPVEDHKYRKMRLQTLGIFGGTATDWTDALHPITTWFHVALMRNNVTGFTSLYWDGVKVLTVVNGSSFNLPDTSTAITIGRKSQAGTVLIDDVRLTLGAIYTDAGFTPPARGTLPDPV